MPLEHTPPTVKPSNISADMMNANEKKQEPTHEAFDDEDWTTRPEKEKDDDNTSDRTATDDEYDLPPPQKTTVTPPPRIPPSAAKVPPPPLQTEKTEIPRTPQAGRDKFIDWKKHPEMLSLIHI